MSLAVQKHLIWSSYVLVEFPNYAVMIPSLRSFLIIHAADQQSEINLKEKKILLLRLLLTKDAPTWHPCVKIYLMHLFCSLYTVFHRLWFTWVRTFSGSHTADVCVCGGPCPWGLLLWFNGAPHGRTQSDTSDPVKGDVQWSWSYSTAAPLRKHRLVLRRCFHVKTQHGPEF